MLCRWIDVLTFGFIALQFCLQIYWKIPNLIMIILVSTAKAHMFRCPHCGYRLSQARVAKAFRDETTICRYCENPILGEARPARDPSEPPPWV